MIGYVERSTAESPFRSIFSQIRICIDGTFDLPQYVVELKQHQSSTAVLSFRLSKTSLCRLTDRMNGLHCFEVMRSHHKLNTYGWHQECGQRTSEL